MVVNASLTVIKKELSRFLFFHYISSLFYIYYGSLSTVVGDEKLTSREDRIGPLFMYVQCDEDTFLKVDEVSKTEAQAFNVFN